MAEVTLINGYELIPQFCKVENWQNEISFTELESDLGEGMDSGVLFGANTGNQIFRMSMKLKDYSDSKTVEYNGQMMTPAEYLWDLYCRTRVTRTPFVIQNIRNNQYYLVKFANKTLSYQLFFHKYYSADGLELVQVRRQGVHVFDVLKLSGVWGWYKADTLGLSNGQSLVGWANSFTGGLHPFTTTNLAYSTPAQNGLGTVTFNGTSSFMSITGAPAIKQAFIVMKVNSATWANYGGVLTHSAVAGGIDAALVGSSGTTKFESLSLGTHYAYRKNTISYAESNQQAPMNAYGLVHIRHKTGFSGISNLIVGNDRGQSGRYAAMNVAEIILCSSHVSDSDGREISQYLKDKWRF